MLTSLTNKSQYKSYRSAFTLVEILVVVAIVALIASATGGLYMGTFKDLQLEKAAKEIYLAAKYARLGAVEKQTSFRLAINKDEGKIAVLYRRENPETQELEEVIVSNPYTRPVTLPGGVTIEDLRIVQSIQMVEPEKKAGLESEEEYEEPGSIVVFTPYGTADSAVIKIGNGKTSYTISVSPATGKAKIIRGETEMPMDVIDLDELEA